MSSEVRAFDKARNVRRRERRLIRSWRRAWWQDFNRYWEEQSLTDQDLWVAQPALAAYARNNP